MRAAEKRGDHSAALALYFAMVQQSLDDLKAAGEWYPYDYWFRTAQANQLYVLSADIPDLTVSAETAIGYALAVDSTQPSARRHMDKAHQLVGLISDEMQRIDARL